MVKRKVIKTKKSEDQLKYEKSTFLVPIKKTVPKAPSRRTPSIKLPAYMCFRIKEGTKTLIIYMMEQEGISNEKNFVNNSTSDNNMQEDNAAFEGWAICLKAWLSDKIERVILKWDVPNCQSEEKTLHYNRFLYRVLRFSEYYNWFGVDETNIRSVNEFSGSLCGLSNNCFSDIPRLKEGNNKTKLCETVVEYMLANYFSSTIKSFYQLDLIDRQFPVGVKKNGKQFFTGNMSAIDLWGIKDKILTIIELKYNGESSSNIKVGIISELFMYSCIMHDIIKGIIAPSDNTLNENEQRFYNNCKSFEMIHAEMLSDKFHPLLDNDRVIELLNARKSLDNIKIIYRKTKYKVNELVSFI